MKTKLPALLAVAGLFASAAVFAAADTAVTTATPAKATTTPAVKPAAGQSVMAQLQDLVNRVRAKVSAGSSSEADFAAELKEFDALRAAHQNEKTEEIAQVEIMKDMLYVQVFHDSAKGIPMLEKLAADFPATNIGKQVAAALPQLKQQAVASAVNDSLKVGTPFPDFDVRDLDGKQLSVAGYKGKIVLIDFWATWCGPCVGEMPNVIAAYNKYHSQGFDIIGVSLDDEKASGKTKLLAFIKDNKMPWAQYYDGKYWSTDLAVKYGIHSIPQSYLLDGTGKIIAVSPRGPALAPAIEKALAAK